MTSADNILIEELKQLIIDSCEKEVTPADIDNDAILFGPESALALDSLDALQISMALQKRYGVRLTDSKETRRIMSSVANLAAYIAENAANFSRGT